MLKSAPIRAYLPVSDVSRARKFYEGIVGLVPRLAVSQRLGVAAVQEPRE